MGGRSGNGALPIYFPHDLGQEIPLQQADELSPSDLT